MIAHAPAAETAVLLLTATVDPGGCARVARADPAQRLADYRGALRRWIGAGVFRAIVLCENSACDPGRFAEEAAQARDAGVALEVLSFRDPLADPARGKGWGEMGIVAHALAASALIPRARHVYKCTGRYFVPAAASLRGFVDANADASVVCDLRDELRTADCRWFAATPAFLRDRLLPQRQVVDDSRGVFFEHALARAAHAALAAGERWALPPTFPVIEGTSGTTGGRLGSVLLKQLQYPLRRRLIRY